MTLLSREGLSDSEYIQVLEVSLDATIKLLSKERQRAELLDTLLKGTLFTCPGHKASLSPESMQRTDTDLAITQDVINNTLRIQLTVGQAHA